MFFLILEELIRISPARTVIIHDTRKSNKCFCATLDLWVQNNFRSKLRLKTSNSFVRKLHFRQKRKVEGRGDISKILDVESRNLQWPIYNTNTLLATWLLYSLNSEFPWKRFDCSMSPHFMVQKNVIKKD